MSDDPITHGIPLLDYLNERLRAQERSVDKAEMALQVRLAEMNQFREQIQKERGDYVTREIFSTRIDLVETRIRSMETAIANFTGRAAAFGIALTIGGAVINMLFILVMRYVFPLK